MSHAVAPVFDKVFMEKFVLSGSKRVLELSRVAEANFLVPSFTSHSSFSFERGCLRHCNIEIGKGDCQSGILGSLRYIGSGGNCPFGTRESVGEAHSRRLGVFRES